MAKSVKTYCDRCDSKVVAGAAFCATCGYPTTWASHSDRTAWEVAQYRHKTANVPMGFAYEPAPRPAGPAPAKSRGVGRVFSRRAHMPQLHVAEQKRTEPPAPEPVLTPEPAHDAPATVLAMRLLNWRVAELDGKLQAIERELAILRVEKPRRWFSL